MRRRDHGLAALRGSSVLGAEAEEPAVGVVVEVGEVVGEAGGVEAGAELDAGREVPVQSEQAVMLTVADLPVPEPAIFADAVELGNQVIAGAKGCDRAPRGLAASAGSDRRPAATILACTAA